MSLDVNTITNSGGFALTGANAGLQQPQFRRGSVRLKESFSSIFNILASGGGNPLNALYGVNASSIQEASQRWELNLANLSGMSLHDDGSDKSVMILPTSTPTYTWFVYQTPETTQFTTLGSTTNQTHSGTTVTFAVSTTDVLNFNVGDVLINFSNSETKAGRVSAVDTATGVVSVVAHGDGASDFSAVTDFFVGAATNDLIQKVANTQSVNRSTNLAADKNVPGYIKSTVKTASLQLIDEKWEEPKFFDQDFRETSDKNPQAQQAAEHAALRLISNMGQAILWNRKQDYASGQNYATFSGLNEQITTNRITASSGLLSISDLDEMLVDKLGNTAGSKEYYGFCSFATLQYIEGLFNSLGAESNVIIDKLGQGVMANPINRISYRGNAIYLFPVSEFHNQGARTFMDQTSTEGARRAGKLFIVDPSTPKIILGRDSAGQVEFMKVYKDINERKEQIHKGKTHAIQSLVGFCLTEESRCGVIENIQGYDISA